jgi:hypothetical protein
MYYIHVYKRCDDDPDCPTTWTEIRLSKTEKLPEWEDSLNVEEGSDGLVDMINYCIANNYEYKVLAVTTQRTAEDERRDMAAFLTAESARFDDAAKAIPTKGNEAAFRALERERLLAVAAAGRTWAAYLSHGDHVGVAAVQKFADDARRSKETT